MANNIPVSPPSGLPYNSNIVSNSSWKISPPEVFFYWFMNSAPPGSFDVKFTFPRIDSIPEFSDFSEWQFEAAASHLFFFIIPSPTVPFTKANGEDSYVGDLGDLNSENNYDKVLSFSFFNLGLLNEGANQAVYTARVTAINPLGQRVIISEREFQINLFANAFTFSLNPPFNIAYIGKQFNFNVFPAVLLPVQLNYFQGGAAPELEVFYFGLTPTGSFAPDILEVSDEIITSSVINIHPYFSKIKFSFDSDIGDLSLGSHEFIIQIGRNESIVGTYPEIRFSIPIVLNVFPDPETDLSIFPEEIIFDVVTGAPPVAGQVLNVVSAFAWSLISEFPEWLSVSQVSGSGNAVILLNPQNYNQLQAGQYSAVLSFQLSDGEDPDIVNVTVIMNLKVFLSTPFEPGKLFYTKQDDYLDFTTENINTYVELIVNIKYFTRDSESGVQTTRTYNIPFGNKSSRFHLGSVIHDFFEEIEKLQFAVPDVNSNYWKPNYRPIEVSISFQEKQYEMWFVPPPLTQGSIDTFMFAKGYKPFTTSSQLALLSVQQQGVVRIHKEDPVGISFVSFDIPTVVVKRNNIVIDTLELNSFSGTLIYSYYRFLNDLRPGDLLELYVTNGQESRSHRYLVHRDGKESTFIFFENSNGVVEPYSLSGRRRITSNYNHLMSERFRNLFSVDQKLKTKTRQSFVVDTGYLEPDDKKVIDQIAKSEKVWVGFSDFKDVILECSCITQRNLIDDTDQNEISYSLEFNILENSDAVLHN